MASNVQKTPAGLSLNRFAKAKALGEIARLGRSLPCEVVKVSGGIVTVSFQVQAVPGQPAVTIDNVTIPVAGSEYVRAPIQLGCKGYAAAADAYLGGMSGLGGGVATTAAPANLTALVFYPIGNVDWFAVDGTVLTMYGPGGVTLMDQAQTTMFKLTPGQIQMTAGGKTMTINSSGITLDGVLWDTHFHVAPGGGGDTGGPL